MTFPSFARLLSLFALLALLLPVPAMALSRGIDLTIKTLAGEESIPLYRQSYALLIGVSDYTHGWPDLTSIPGEMEALEKALKEQGFTIVKLLDPDSRSMTAAFEDFINQYGLDRDNRLLFFFSGHGYSRSQAEKGYIVPSDAPSPLEDEKGFVRKAVEMEQVVTWARRIESKHALFLFDSCFSGTVFQSRALPAEPPHISAMAARPVRQFISAGSAGEEVPARSYFVPSFIRAMEGEGDLDGDGYVTGTELGMFINRKVTGYRVGQTPQYGKIRDPRLDQGDFVLLAGGSGPRPSKDSGVALTVRSNPAGASVSINGRLRGETPLAVDVPDGTVRVQLEMKGYRPHEETVLVRKGRPVTLDFALEKKILSGSVEVTSDPAEAKWYLDGAYAGTTPDTLLDVEPGEYQITIRAEGFSDWSGTVTVTGGEISRVTAALEAEAPADAGAAEMGGVVTEVLVASPYTYVEVEAGQERFWAAAPEFAVEVGDSVLMPAGFPMTNFHSAALNRTWELISFVDYVSVLADAPAEPAADLSATIPALKELVAKDPANREAWVQLGHAYFDANDPTPAIAAYQKALELDPLDSDVLTDLAVMQRSLGKTADAIESLKRALTLEPEHPQALFNLGVVYRYDAGEDRKAYYYWDKFIAAHPQSPAADQVKTEIGAIKEKIMPVALTPSRSCVLPRSEIKSATTWFEAFFVDNDRFPSRLGELKVEFDPRVELTSVLDPNGNYILTATGNGCDRIFVRHGTRTVIDEVLK